MVRPGVAGSEIDGAVNAFLQSEYPDYQTEEGRLHRTGHGIGLGNHEAPSVAEGSEDRLAENMVISVEPGIYIPGLGGVRHSDTVLITGTGYEPLTRLPTSLAALTIRGWRPLARAKGWLLRRALRLAGRAGRSERPG
jgi:Xaa-Pro dipeptidase